MSHLQRCPELRDLAMQLQRRYLDAYRMALVDARSVGAFSTAALQDAQTLLDRIAQRLDAAVGVR